MANEATKKDLADLEKRVNTKLQTLVDTTNKEFARQTGDINKSIEAMNKNFTDNTAYLKELQTAINQHAKLINDLEKKCG